MMKKWILALILVLSPWIIEARQPDLTPPLVCEKMNEIMKAHAKYNNLTPELVRRSLNNYLEELDPAKTYFIKEEINEWMDPSDALVEEVMTGYQNCEFPQFARIYDVFVKAIERRHAIDKEISVDALPEKVKPEEFKDLKWAESRKELVDRIERIKSLQIETAGKLNEELQEKSLQRIAKRQAKFEEDYLTNDPVEKERLMLSKILKASASALDTHTAYLTPEEATQFMISVQQRLFGIGAQLRDDLNGFSVIKVIEGGPAAEGGELKAKDRIVAVDGEPVVGMDILDAVELIRGEKGTPVKLKVIREEKEGDETKEVEKDITIVRDEVILKETRYETSVEPFGDGAIGYVKLFSFYQDPEHSSAKDMSEAIEQMKKDYHLKGLILDLRYNSGGLLSQAVDVTGLFITKGVVVSIKDHNGKVQHLRNLDGNMVWDGPLVVLVNRASASASEIVAQTLQDYGRAIIVGDDHTFGKGSFQTFTLNTTKNAQVDPYGEYKVTRGRYYTVSGKTPQLTGVLADINVPGPLSEVEIGEQYAKYPLEGDTIDPSYDDDLGDIPYMQRERVRLLYKFDLQPKLEIYKPYYDVLAQNSEKRIEHNKNYQNFLKEIKRNKEEIDEEEPGQFGENDLQLTEAFNIMKDLLFIMQAHREAAAGT